MELLIKLFTVFLLGIISQPAGIATGLALQLGPLSTAAMATLGGILAVLVILGLGERIRKWKWVVDKHYCEVKKDRSGRICQIWDRYGIAGLGLLSPSLVGAPIGTVIGIILGSPIRSLLYWMSAGIVIWSVISAFGLDLGIAGIRALWH